MGDGMGVITKRGAALLLIICSLPLFAAPWVGGYRLTFDGYSDGAALANDEHLGVHIWLAPLDLPIGDPLLSVGVLFPSYGSSPGPIVEGGLEIRLFDWAGHPLSPLFRRQSAWRPTIGIGLLAPILDLEAAHLALTIHPLSFFFGEKTVSILAPRLLYEFGAETWAWAVRLVEISHSLF